MILTHLPDVPPNPITAANAAFRAEFYRRWGRENFIVCGDASRMEFSALTHVLSVKTALGGAERYVMREREIVVDDDHWLVLNQGQRYGSVIRAPRAMHSFSVFFRPDMAAEVAAARRQSIDSALEEPRPERSAMPRFSEHLRSHGGCITAQLRALRGAVLAGERDESWLEERLLALMAGLMDEEAEPAPHLAARRSAQAELVRRLRRAADHIDSCHAQALDLDAMAGVACLSRFHFVRHFRALYGITPYAFLLRKRARVAQRLLTAGEMDREAVAAAAGFGSRFAMARALRRYSDTSPG